MMKIAICDDQAEHRQSLHALLSEYAPPESAIEDFPSADALLRSFDNGAFDVFFLDIELGSESGVQLARRINARFPASQIIFVTANIINAIDVSEANHVYFLTKPVDPNRLQSALHKAMQRLDGQTDRRLSVTLRGGGSGVVAAGRILYCERTKRTTTMVCTNETLAAADSLDELEEKLPRLLFTRPHNSFLVNLGHVSKLERTAVYLDDGTQLPVSNQRKNAFRAALAAYVTRI